MDFLDRIRVVLREREGLSSPCEAVDSWNSDIESFLSSPPTSETSKQEAKEEVIKGSLDEVSSRLHTGILGAIMSGEAIQYGMSEEQRKEITKSAVERFQNSQEEVDMKGLSQYLRASKNFLRWSIQLNFVKTHPTPKSPVDCFEEDTTLELFVRILDHIQSSNIDTSSNFEQALGRTVSLLLFYATYSPFSGDANMQKSLYYLVEDLKFTDVVLRILLRPCTAAFALSLVRNIHNVLVSLQGGIKIVSKTSTDWNASASLDKALWAPKVDGTVTFRGLFVEIIRWALDSDPKFPGPDDDKRAELIIEILGTFYALRVGRELQPENLGGDSSVSKLVLDLLRLPKNDDERPYRCKLSTVSLFMDSHPSFSDYLVTNDAVIPLLDILETQATKVLDDTIVDDSAAAALVPILAVINKFSIANTTFQQQVKDFIFPPEAEKDFLAKVEEFVNANGTSKNMMPLDAPKGTLRWKLTHLMTWMQSHVKRCTGELLWTVCSSDATEFVQRTGLGNALPMLNLKGFVDLPSQVTS